MPECDGNELLGSVTPRIWTPPLRELTPETSYGFEAIDFANRVYKRPYDPWQEWLVIHAGELLPDGRPRFNMVLVLVARQNGKTEVPVLLSPYWMFLEQHPLILGTSTKVDYAKESWEKVLKIIQNTPDLAIELPRNGVRRSNGENEITTADDCRYKISASNEEAGRSLTISRLILDEIRQHYDWLTYNAAFNAMNAVPDAQAWALSNQGDERGIVLDGLRDSALHYIQSGDGDYRLGLFEWSAPLGSDPTDPAAIAMANPNLGRRIMLDSIMGQAKRAKAAGGKQLNGFLTEVLCMRVRKTDPAIPEEQWVDCELPGSLDGLRGKVALCIDVSMDSMHASLVAAAMQADGKVRVDVVKAWDGPGCTAQLRRELPALVRRIRPRALGWLPAGPAASIAAEFTQSEDQRVDGQRRRPHRPFGPSVAVDEIRGEVTAVCMGLAEMVKARDVVHTGDPMLLAHIGGAERLWQGDAWRFIRRGAGHCDGAYATAGAVHLARILPPAPAKPKLVVSSRTRAARES